MSSSKILSISGLIYLVALVFYFLGGVTGQHNLFPWNHIVETYDEIHAYFTFKEGPTKTVKDKVMLDHQEHRTEYKTAGLTIRDKGFKDKGYLLLARYSKSHGQCIVELMSIEQNKVLHTWVPSQPEIYEKSKNLGPNTRESSTFRAQHPFLMKNGDLVFTTGEGPLVRVNACGELKWIIPRHFHHSVERDHEGNFVGCIVLLDRNPALYPIKNDGVAIVSPEGKILKEYSAAEVLLKNGYRTLLYGIGPFSPELIHLNDAQPIMADSPGYKVGDILLSMRNISTVALFEPGSQRIKWLKTGPWLYQHDIDQLDASRVSIFGNDVVEKINHEMRSVNNGVSDVYIYDWKNNKVTQPFTAMMKKERIGTNTGGRAELLPNGDVYIEQTDHSRLIRISKDKVRWEYVNKATPETVGAVHWCRYLPGDSVDLSWLANLKCK